MRKLIGFSKVCVLMIMLILLTACGKKKEEPMPTLSPFASQQEIDEYNKKMASKIKVKKANGKYKYNQKDNVINDKYRNFYHIMVATFCDSNGDGMGDINGIISKLDYLEDMGYNGIWLTPIMESSEYHKYAISNYTTVDKDFGTVDDFKKLADECKKRDICLILDLVLNHTSTKHPWFQEALKGLGDTNNKYFNYYNFNQTKLTDKYYLAGNGWYYEGEFWDQMPDLKLNNPDVRKEFESIVDYWMNFGIGGFRLDAIIHFEEDKTADNVEILKWLNSYVKEKNPDAYIVGEAWVDNSTSAQYLASGIDSVFNFDFADGGGTLVGTARAQGDRYKNNKFTDAMISQQELIKQHNPSGIDAPFLSNHDTARSAGFLGEEEDQIKLSIALYQFMTGATFTYYGEEIGLLGSGEQDVNFRYGMYWSDKSDSMQPAAPNGCSLTNDDMKFGSVAKQKKDKNSILNYTKRILQIKNENPEIARGIVEKIDVKDKDLIAYKKVYNGESVIIIINASDYAKQFNFSKSNGYKKIRGYATVDDTEVTLQGEKVTMSGNAVVVLK